MRKPRGFLSRAFAATMLLWLGLVLTEPLPLDACPMHGSHSMHAAAMAGSAAHHSMGSGHDSSQKSASHQCTCIGDCSAAKVAFALLFRGETCPDAVTTALGERGHVRAQALRVASSEHILPPANGPPAIS
jgi:hypothetical protein